MNVYRTRLKIFQSLVALVLALLVWHKGYADKGYADVLRTIGWGVGPPFIYEVEDGKLANLRSWEPTKEQLTHPALSSAWPKAHAEIARRFKEKEVILVTLQQVRIFGGKWYFVFVFGFPEDVSKGGSDVEFPRKAEEREQLEVVLLSDGTLVRGKEFVDPFE